MAKVLAKIEVYVDSENVGEPTTEEELIDYAKEQIMDIMAEVVQKNMLSAIDTKVLDSVRLRNYDGEFKDNNNGYHYGLEDENGELIEWYKSEEERNRVIKDNDFEVIN